ncbi:MAG TPA: hypothetical protein VE173_05830, partial [Longimicrobiales bacterium]|nr:hypothetical protein [Longimicrobiales bacterium]
MGLAEYRRRRLLVPVGYLALGASACGTSRSFGVTVTDSAGVRVTSSPEVPRTFAMVDSPAVLSLGG